MKTLLLMLLSLLFTVDSLSPKNTNSNWFDEIVNKEIDLSKKVKKIKVPNIELSYSFKENLVIMADTLNIKVEYLLTVFHVETMGTFKANKRSPIGATGLIQFTNSTAKWIGTNTNLLAKMSLSEQLKYVSKYLDNIIKYYGSLDSLEDVFMAVHYPISIRKGLYSTVYKIGSPAYTANRFNDRNKDGKVTKYEICNFVRSIYKKYYVQKESKIKSPYS